MYKVSSEIFKETNFQSVKSDGKVVSSFKFVYPEDDHIESTSKNDANTATTDSDGDFILKRRNRGAIEIAHSDATELRLVGLQVWRGALLLADFIFHQRNEFREKNILELGAGTGLTSIAAAIYCRQIACTDVDIGGILDLIRENVQRNEKLKQIGKVEVLEYDFLKPINEYPQRLREIIANCEIVVAADVIYDDTLTDAFLKVVEHIFAQEKIGKKQRKEIYIAMEKRFVFAFSELDAVAPMYEYFMKQLNSKPWHIDYVPLDFPQFFDYERCKELILLKITSI